MINITEEQSQTADKKYIPILIYLNVKTRYSVSFDHREEILMVNSTNT